MYNYTKLSKMKKKECVNVRNLEEFQATTHVLAYLFRRYHNYKSNYAFLGLIF